MKSVCMFVFQEPFTTHGAMPESRDLFKKVNGIINGRIVVMDDELILIRQCVQYEHDASKADIRSKRSGYSEGDRSFSSLADVFLHL